MLGKRICVSTFSALAMSASARAQNRSKSIRIMLFPGDTKHKQLDSFWIAVASGYDAEKPCCKARSLWLVLQPMWFVAALAVGDREKFSSLWVEEMSE